jgi:death-on-curing protein
VKIRIITVAQVEEISHRMARIQMEWDEPIPDFGTRYPGKLESCLVQAFQTYSRRDLYPTVTDKAAIMFYLLIKNHPFLNGNKRMAVTTVITFLLINGKWLKIENEQLYNLAVWVAKSDPQGMNGVLLAINNIISRNLVELK